MLRDYVAGTIDLLNAEAGLMLAGGEHEVPVEEVFVEGGKILTRAGFLRAATAADPGEAWRSLAPGFQGTALAEAFDSAKPPPGGLEPVVLAALIKAWHRQARLAPVGIAPVIEYLLRLRAQVLQVRALVWSTALGMPFAARKNQLLAT